MRFILAVRYEHHQIVAVVVVVVDAHVAMGCMLLSTSVVHLREVVLNLLPNVEDFKPGLTSSKRKY